MNILIHSTFNRVYTYICPVGSVFVGNFYFCEVMEGGEYMCHMIPALESENSFIE